MMSLLTLKMQKIKRNPIDVSMTVCIPQLNGQKGEEIFSIFTNWKG